MFYLLYIISILRIDYTIVFYMARWTKLDHTCIYFDDILHYYQLMWLHPLFLVATYVYIGFLWRQLMRIEIFVLCQFMFMSVW